MLNNYIILYDNRSHFNTTRKAICNEITDKISIKSITRIQFIYMNVAYIGTNVEKIMMFYIYK